MTAAASVPSSYRPQIDGLRALAVLAVLVSHLWTPHVPVGVLGVRLFFVISGFLITEKLLDARALIVQRRSTWQTEIARFVQHRVLRIFPAYYALLAALFLFDWGEMRDSALWHLFYLSNVYFARMGDWVPWPTAHLWSLSIEEQFYLIWPWILLLAPRRWFAGVMAGLVIASTAYRYLLVSGPVEPAGVAIWVSLPAAVDTLAAGALLAMAVRRQVDLRRWEWLGLPAAAGWLAISILITQGHLPNLLIYTFFVQGLCTVIAFTALVSRAHRTCGDTMGIVLSLPPVVALGRISYGVYLFHMPLLAWLLTLIPDLDYGPRRFAYVGAATVLLAAVSWRVLERPLLRLKARSAGGADRPVAPSAQP